MSTDSKEHIIKSLEQLIELSNSNQNKLGVLLIYSSSYEPSISIFNIIKELYNDQISKQYIDTDNCEGLDEIIEKFNIEDSPSVIFLYQDKEITNSRFINSDPTMFVKAQNIAYELYEQWDRFYHDECIKLINDLIKSSKIFCFIKGEKDQPFCKYSKQLVNLLENQKFNTFNIFSNYRLRETLKIHNNWPTYPQIFSRGEFVGGIDVVKEIFENNQQKEIFSIECVKNLELYYSHEEITNQQNNIQMENIKDKKIVIIYYDEDDRYLELIKILKNVDVNQFQQYLDNQYLIDIANKLSNNLVQPKLIVSNEYIDINDKCDNQFFDIFNKIKNQYAHRIEVDSLNDRICKLINKSKVMLFMKGTPESPNCGFSNTIVKLLSNYNLKYSTFDILSDNEIREGLKKYSNWPTQPQLYVDGELLGGLDVVKEMHEDGSLSEFLT